MALKPYWENGHYYGLISKTNSNWPDAYTEAGASNSSNLGSDIYGYLAHPNDSNEYTFIRNYANNGGSVTVDHWLGGTDSEGYGGDEGTWIWVSWIKGGVYGPDYGTQFRHNNADNGAYSNWRTSSGEPNNRNDEDYLLVSGKDGTWVDVNGSYKTNYYVIEYGNSGAQYNVYLDDYVLNGIEDNRHGIFRIKANKYVGSDYVDIRNGTPLVDIPLTFGGTAIRGVDYTVSYSNSLGGNGSTAYIINSDYVDVWITPSSDAVWDSSKSVTISLGSDPQGIYQLSGPSYKRLVLWDDEPVLTLGQSLKKSIWYPYSRSDSGLPSSDPDFVTFDANIDESQTSFNNEGLVEWFGVRWEGYVQVPVSGSYTFSTTADDGVRLYLDDALSIDRWSDSAPTTNYASSRSYTAGHWVKVRLDYYQGGGGLSVSLNWTRPNSTGSGTTTEVIPSSAFSPVLPGTDINEVSSDKKYRAFQLLANRTYNQTINATTLISSTGDATNSWETAPTFDNASANALVFNGSASINLGNPSQLQLNKGTIEAWIKTANAGSDYRGIVTKAFAYSLFLHDNQLVAFSWASGAHNTGIYLNDDRWHHVALSFNSGEGWAQIYVDGQPVGDAFPYTVANNDGAATIGGASNTDNQIFSGAIDEVRIWNTVRSATDIKDYSTYPYGKSEPSVPTSLVGYYALDTASGSLVDASAYANTVSTPGSGVNRTGPVSAGTVDVSYAQQGDGITSRIGDDFRLYASETDADNNTNALPYGINKVSLPTGQLSQNLYLKVLRDDYSESNEKVSLGLIDNAYGNSSDGFGVVGGPSTVQIVDQPIVVSVSGVSNPTEGSLGYVDLSFSRPVTSAAGLRLSYSLGSGTATVESDFLGPKARMSTFASDSGYTAQRLVYFPKDSSQGTIYLTGLEDAIAEGIETISLQIENNTITNDNGFSFQNYIVDTDSRVANINIGDNGLYKAGLALTPLNRTGTAVARFDGVDDSLNLTWDEPETGISREIVFRTDQANGGLFQIGTGSEHDRSLFLVNGNLASFVSGSDASPIQTSGRNFADNNWHRLLFTLGSQGGHRLYVDGELLATGVGTSSNYTWQTAARLGYAINASNPHFDGEIRSLRSWNSELSEKQATGNASALPPPTQWFDFNSNRIADLTAEAGNLVSGLTTSGGLTTVATTSLQATKTNTASLQLKLTSQPMATVTVTLAATNARIDSSTTLTFTASNWDTPQIIQLSDVASSSQATVTATASSEDSSYSSLNTSLNILPYSPSSRSELTLQEGGAIARALPMVTIGTVGNATEGNNGDFSGFQLGLSSPAPAQGLEVFFSVDGTAITTEGAAGQDLGILADHTYRPLVLNSSSSQYLDLPATQTGGVNNTVGFTLEAWLNLSSYTNNAKVIDLGDASSTDTIQLGFDGTTGKPVLHVGRAGHQILHLVADAAIPTDQWVHLAASFDGNQQASLYVNGVVVKTATATDLPIIKTRQINRVGASISGDSYLNGSIRGVKIWNQSRLPEQIASDMLLEASVNDPDLAYGYELNGSLAGIVREFESFNSVNGWKGGTIDSSSTYYGNVLGLYANGPKVNGQDTKKSFVLDGQPATISFDFARIDSWDGEHFRVYIDDAIVFARSFPFGASITADNGRTNGYTWSIVPKDELANYAGASFWNDQTATITIEIPAGKSSVTIGFGSTLDQATSDESYAIDNFRIATDSTPTTIDPFDTADGWTNGKVDASSTYYGKVLGLYGNDNKINGQDASKKVYLNGQLSYISFDFARIDSWDGEDFRVYIDDTVAFEMAFRYDADIKATSGSTNGYSWIITPKDKPGLYAGQGWSDQTATISIAIPAGRSTAKIGFGSTLDQATNDEAYAIDNLIVTSGVAVNIRDSFDAANGWSGGTTNTSSSYYGSVLGLYANGAKSNGQDTNTTFALGGLATILSFDFARIDSWDGEDFRVYIDDTVAFEMAFRYDADIKATSGSTNGYSWIITPKDNPGLYAGQGWSDQTATISIAIPAGRVSAKIGFGSSLDQANNDEAYAIDNLTIRTLTSASLANAAAFAASPLYSLNVKAGEQQFTLPINSLEDSQAEDNETVKLTLINGPGYTINSETTSATYTHSDEDSAGVAFAINTASSSQPDSWSPLQAGDDVRVSESDAAGSHVTRMGMRLTSQPSANVQVTPSANTGNTEVALFSAGTTNALGSLVFTPTNWNVYQSFDLQGNDDTLDDGEISLTLGFSTVSSDAQYNTLATSLVTTNIDNEPTSDLNDAFANSSASSGLIATVSAPVGASLSESTTTNSQTITVQLSAAAAQDTQVFFALRATANDESAGHDFTIKSSSETTAGLNCFIFTDYNNPRQDLVNPSQVRIDKDGIDESSASFSTLGVSERFAARWSGFVYVPYDGYYTFKVLTDDGSRLYLDNNAIIDKWFDQGTSRYLSNPIWMEAGSYHSIQYDFYNDLGPAVSSLSWIRPDPSGTNNVSEVIPAANLRRNGADYVTIPKGSTSASFTVQAIDDQESEGTSQVSFGLLSNPQPQLTATNELSVRSGGTSSIPLQLTASTMDSLLLKAGTVLKFGDKSISAPNSSAVAELTVAQDTTLYRSAPREVKVTFTGQAPQGLSGLVAGLDSPSPYRTDVNIRATKDISRVGLTKQMYSNYTNTDVKLGDLDPTAVVVDVDGISDSETTTPGFSDAYAVRWMGTITIPTTGSYQFQSSVDDGARLTINGVPIIDQWSSSQRTTTTSSSMDFMAGDQVTLVYDFYEIGGGANATLRWIRPNGTGGTTTEVIPASVCTPFAQTAQLNLQLNESAGVTAQVKAGDTLLFSGGSSAQVLSDATLSANSSTVVNVSLSIPTGSNPTVLANETSHLDVSRLATIKILDNDIAGFLFSSDAAGLTPMASSSTIDLNEAGAAQTRYVALKTQPTATVILSLETADPSEALLSQGNGGAALQRIALSFTPTNWATPQAFVINPVDDQVDDGNISFNVHASSSSDDPAYHRLRASGTPATFAKAPSVSEDFTTIKGWSTATPASTANDGDFLGVFAADIIKANGQDTSKTFAIASTAVRVEFTFLRFDSWDPGECFQVFINDTKIINQEFTSSYYSSSAPIKGSNDAGFSWTITPVEDYGNRNDTSWSDQTFNVVLTVPPLSDTLKIGFGSTVDQADSDESYGIDNFKIFASDGKVFTVNTIDDDDSGVIANVISGSAAEGGNGFLDVSLSSQPSSDVHVTLRPSDSQFTLSDLNISRSEQLTFTPSSWNLPQQVQLVAVDDDVAEDTTRSQLKISTSSSDSTYNNLTINDLPVVVLDNDVPTARLQFLDDANEGGKPGSFQIVLNSPTSTSLGSTGLTINYSISAVSNTANDSGGVPAADSIDQIAQTPASSNGSVRIAPGRTASNSFVVPIDDFVDDTTDKSFQLTLSSGSGYQLDPNASSATFTIKDDDTAGFMIIESGDRTRVTEGGPSAQFQIQLLSQPTANVVITITDDSTYASGSNTRQLDFPAGSSGVHTFTSDNWYIPQKVDIIANDENVIEDGIDELKYTGIHPGQLKYTFASGDSLYDSTGKSADHFTKTSQEIEIVDRPLDPLTYQGLDESLTALQDSLDGLALPIVGSLEGKTGISIRSFLDELVESVRTSGDQLTAKKLQKLLGDAVGFQGDVEIGDHVVVSIDAASSDVEVSFSFDDTYTIFSVPLAADFGLPALNLQTTGSLDADFSYAATLSFGISKETKGFYLDVDPDKTSFNANFNTSLSSDFSLTGGLGFLQIDAVNQPSVHDGEDLLDRSTDLNTDFTITLEHPDDEDNKLTLDELRDANLSDLAKYSITGDAALSLGVTTSIDGSAAIPSFSFDLAALLPLFDYSNQEQSEDTSGQTNFYFDNITLDLGSFVTNFIKQAADQINQILSPVYPLIDALYADTTIFTKLGIASVFDGDDEDDLVSVIELAQWFANFYAEMNPTSARAKQLQAGIESTVAFLDQAKGMIDIISELSDMPSDENIDIDYGSYELSAFNAASDAPENSTKKETVSKAKHSDPASGETPSEAAQTTESKYSKIYNKLIDLGFEIPLIEDPLQVIQILFGQDVDLFTWTMPDMGMASEVEKTFPIYPGISGVIEGTLDVNAALGFGFDTDGLNRWSQDGFAPEDAWKVLDGFYVADVHDDVDSPEFTLDASMAAGLGLNAVVVQASILGGLAASAVLDLIDAGELSGTADGRLRGSEIADQIRTPLNLFEFSGELSAFLEANVQVGIDLGFIQYFETVWEEKLAKIPIFEFGIGGSYSGGGGGSADGGDSTQSAASLEASAFSLPTTVEPALFSALAADILGVDPGSEPSASSLAKPVGASTILPKAGIATPQPSEFINKTETVYFFDSNFNGEVDSQEPSARSLSLNYEPSLRIDHRTFDTNRNGVIDAQEGRIVAHGNIPAVKNLPLDVVYSAPIGAQVSPLSTLYTIAQHAGSSDEEARLRLRALFNLSPGYDFLQRDAVSESEMNFAEAGFSATEQAYVADIKIAILFHLLSQAVQVFEPSQSTVPARLQLQQQIGEALLGAGFVDFDHAVQTSLKSFLDNFNFIPDAAESNLQHVIKQQIFARLDSALEEMDWLANTHVPAKAIESINQSAARIIKDLDQELEAYRVADDSHFSHAVSETALSAGSVLRSLLYEAVNSGTQDEPPTANPYTTVPTYQIDSAYLLQNVEMDPMSAHIDLGLSADSISTDLLLNLKPLSSGLEYDRDFDGKADSGLAPLAYTVDSSQKKLLAASFNQANSSGVRFYDVNEDSVPDRITVSLWDGSANDLNPVVDGTVQSDLTIGLANVDFKLRLQGAGLLVQGNGHGLPTDAMPAAAFTALRLISRSTTQTDVGYVVRNNPSTDPLSLDEVLEGGQRLFTCLPSDEVPDLRDLLFQTDLQLINGQQILFFTLAQSSLADLRRSSNPVVFANAHLNLLTPHLTDPADTTVWVRDDSLDGGLRSDVAPAALSATFGTDEDLSFSIQLEDTAPHLDSLIARQRGDTPLLDFSLLGGESLQLSLSFRREAGYSSKLGFYEIANANGAVFRIDPVTGQRLLDSKGSPSLLQPSDPEYGQMALANRLDNLDSLPAPKNDEILHRDVTVPGGRLLAPYAITDTGTEKLMYFGYGDANPDGQNHFRYLSTTVIGFEDLPGLGDKDYDDVIVSIVPKPLSLPF